MDKRIKELAEQAGLEKHGDGDWSSLNHPDVRAEHLERFAELVRADEREACAKVCEELSKANWTFCNFAEAIRARGNHEQTR